MFVLHSIWSLLHVVQTGSGAHLVSYRMSTGGSIPLVKLLEREPDHSPTSAEVKKVWIYTSTPPYAFWRSAKLVKHRDSFTLSVSINSPVENGRSYFLIPGEYGHNYVSSRPSIGISSHRPKFWLSIAEIDEFLFM
jgi:hypothetical protein